MQFTFADKRALLIYSRLAGVNWPVDASGVPLSYLIEMYPERIRSSFSISHLYQPLINMKRILREPPKLIDGELRRPPGYEDAFAAHVKWFHEMLNLHDEAATVYRLSYMKMQGHQDYTHALFSDHPVLRQEEQKMYEDLSFSFTVNPEQLKGHMRMSFDEYEEITGQHMQGLYSVLVTAPFVGTHLQEDYSFENVMESWLAVASVTADLFEAARVLPVSD